MNVGATDTQTPVLARASLRSMFDFHIVWIVVLCICGMAAYHNFKFEVFPSASIEMTKSKGQIQAQAEQLAVEQGFKKSDLIKSTTFNIDQGAKNYLEHEFKLGDANRIMLTQVPVWTWKTRLCKEYDQEQFRALISPTGQLVSFAHVIPNDAPGKSLTHEEAKKLALSYVQKLEKQSSNYGKLVEDETKPRPKRTDHSFVWENQVTPFKEARLRIRVNVSGDQVTNYNKSLHIPEKWLRDFSTKRSVNDLLTNVSFFFIRGLETLAALVALWGLFTRNIRWRIAIFGGAVMGVLSALDYLNNYPGLLSYYGVTSSFNSYLSEIIVTAAGHLFGDGISSAVLIAGAEIVYRKVFPKQIAFEKLLTKDGLSSQFVVRGALVGHILVAVYFGWMVLYYMCGQRLHYWCPLGVDNYQALSDVVPFVSAIAFGAEASFNEELLCRVIGLGIAMKLCRNFWIANLCQAVIWGFAHSAYPQEPAYARGVELTIEGLFQGWVLRKYGLVACITVHYLQDAFLYVEPYLNSPSLQLRMSVMPSLLPVLLLVGGSLLWNWYQGRNKEIAVTEESLTNESIPLNTSWSLPAAQPPPLTVPSLSSRMRGALTALTAVGILCCALTPESNAVNADARMTITRHEAISKAQQVMREHGIDPTDWITTAYSAADSNAEAYQYVLEQSDRDTVRKNFNNTRRGYYWGIRFCKPLCSEEYCVLLDGHGNENSFSIDREEDDAGGKLTSEEARKKAEEYLLRVHPEQKDCKFKEISSQTRKNRTDFRVEFTNPTLKVGEAEYRVSISVIGDQVGNYQQWWDVPDSWTFARRKSRFIDEIITHAGAALLTIFSLGVIAALVLFARGKTKLFKDSLARLKELYALPFSIRTIPVKIPYTVALVSVAFTFAMNVNFSPQFYSNYWTTVPLATFVADRMLDYSKDLLRSFIGAFVMTYVCLIALAIAVPHSPIVPYLKQVLGKFKSTTTEEQRIHARNIWIDGILIAYAALAYTQITNKAWGMLNTAFSPTIRYHYLGCIPAMSNVELPMLNILLFSILAAAGTGSGLIVMAALFTRIRAFMHSELKRKRDELTDKGLPVPSSCAPHSVRTTLLITLILCVPLIGLECRHWQDFFLVTGFTYVNILAFWFFTTKMARGNFIAYFLFFALGLDLTYLSALLKNGSTLFVPESIVLSLLLAAPLVVAAWLAFTTKAEITSKPSIID
jgi:hypothetical protein